MKKHNTLFLVRIIIIFGFLISCTAQNKTIDPKDKFEWTSIYDGLDYCERVGPYKSVVNDSKIR